MQLQQLLAVGLCLLGWAVLAPPPAAAQPLICDGKARLIDMAKPAFPNGPPWTPLNPADDWTCVRPLAGTSKLCGSMATDSCGAVEFRPILQSSGATPGIIPPDNPLQFKLSANVKGYLTSASFRAGNIGTGGARLRGTYAGTSTLNPVTLDFAWVKNGPTNLPDGTVVFASCGDCRMGFGIMDMTVTALPGAGFRTLELSQLYSDTRCEGSGVNNDGLLWDGSMSYTCVVVSVSVPSLSSRCNSSQLHQQHCQQLQHSNGQRAARLAVDKKAAAVGCTYHSQQRSSGRSSSDILARGHYACGGCAAVCL